MSRQYLTLLAPVLFVIFAFQMVKNQQAVDRRVHYFQYDQAGYYSYLPAVFLYEQDWSFRFFDENGMQSEQFIKQINGQDFNKYPIGVAILQAPFFAVGHVIAAWQGDAQNGFTKPYRRAVFISVLFYITLGLLLLRRVLSRYFSSWVVFWSLAIVGLGTNLIFYSTHEPLMSHGYSFLIFSLIVYISDAFNRTKQSKYILWMGVCAGLVLLTRIPNALVFIIPILWGVFDKESLIIRLSELWDKKIFVLGALGLAFIVFVPQLLYYKVSVGSYWIDPYGDERFFFSDPLFAKVLFSFRKGWLIYTPLCGFALLGFIWLKRYFKLGFWGILIYTVLQFIVVSSWGCWWYGGGFSMRPFTESMAILIFPLASWIQWTTTKQWSQYAFVLILVPFFWLQELHLHQYCKSVIHNDSMSFEAYKVIFGKRSPIGQEVMDRREEVLLRPDPGRVNKDAEFRRDMK